MSDPDWYQERAVPYKLSHISGSFFLADEGNMIPDTWKGVVALMQLLWAKTPTGPTFQGSHFTLSVKTTHVGQEVVVVGHSVSSGNQGPESIYEVVRKKGCDQFTIETTTNLL